MMATGVDDLYSLKIISLNISGLRKKTKHISLLIAKYKPDFICLQETNVNDHYLERQIIELLKLNHTSCFFNYNARKSNGTCILSTSNRWEIKLMKKSHEGRVISTRIQSNQKQKMLINTYAPTNPTERIAFYDDLLHSLGTNKNEEIVLAGDFNITLNDIDILGTSGKQRHGRIELLRLTQMLGVKDAFRDIYKDKRDFTYENASTKRASRIDHIYVSRNCRVKSVMHLSETLLFTDHKGVFVETGKQNSIKNPAHWIFNNSLLENIDFVKTIESVITENQIVNTNNFFDNFEQLKIIFKTISIRFGSKISKERTRREYFLERAIRAFEKKKNKDSEYEKIKLELEELRLHKYKGAYIRSKLPITQERPTKVFLSLESSIQKSRMITEIYDKSKNIVRETTDISSVFKDFYSELYHEEATENSIQDGYLNFVRKLNEEDKAACATQITVQDLKEALWAMNENATPGPNGLTVTFFKRFFDDLKPLFYEFLTLLYKGDNLNSLFKLSYITVLPKDSGSLLEIKNYRPISLLNIEYKMITKALVNKISPVLERLIHPDQAACIKGRNIQGANHLIRDIISLAKLRNDKAAILSIDQAKAYDRVSHAWLFKVLKHCNFSEVVINIIRTLYRDAQSKVLVNKTLSSALTLCRGCRQGDSLSGTIYILCLEPLLEKIRQDTSISGLHIPNKGIQKLIAFADDTNFFLKNSDSIIKILQMFKHFGRASGSLINVNKTKLMAIGEGIDIEHELSVEIVQEIKMLGLFYKNALNQSSEQNWAKLIAETESKINKIYYKQATIFGRAILVNTFIEPKLVYPAMTLDPPIGVIKSFKKLIRAFIFKGTLPCIRHNTIIQKKYDGGINLHDMDLKVKSFRFKYLYKIIDDPNKYPLASYFMHQSLPDLIDQNEHEVYNGLIPDFYTNIKDIYTEYDRIFHSSTNSTIYHNLLQTKKEHLNDQVKRSNDVTDFTEIFRNLHENRYTTHTQKQVMYRILFGITPTSEGLAKRHKRIFFCKLCSYQQETEEHMFYFCKNIETIKLDLIKLLRQPHNTYIDLYKSIFLNIVPKEDDDDLYRVKKAFVAIYRETIWTIRNDATHKNHQFSGEQIRKIFSNKVAAFVERFKGDKTVELFSY